MLSNPEHLSTADLFGFPILSLLILLPLAWALLRTRRPLTPCDATCPTRSPSSYWPGWRLIGARKATNWALRCCDAVHRVVAVSENAGVRAVLVHALNDRAKQFYEHYGFQASPVHPMTLMMRLQAAKSPD